MIIINPLKSFDRSGIRTHAPEETGVLNYLNYCAP